MDERAVVTCFLRHGPSVLLLRRSDAVGTYRGLWAGVSGFAEGTPDEAARWEIHEEVGLLDAAEVVRSGDPIPVEDEDLDRRWLVHPYLFDCDLTAVDPGEEVADFEWVQPPAIFDHETVPKLWEAYAAVAPTVASVREDDDHGSSYVSLRALERLRDRAAAIAAGHETADRESADQATIGHESTDLAALARDLRSTRPSMGVVANRINRVMSEADGTPAGVRDAAMDACERAVRADGEAAAAAVDVLGERVLTLSRSGTVLDALCEAAPEVVFVAESRPAREGVAVAEEIAGPDLDVALCVDAAMGHVVATEAVDTVLVGADSVLADGAVVNKVGTRLAALAAREAGANCYAVCSRAKIVPESESESESRPGSKSGSESAVELESGPPEAVHGRSAPFRVVNPTFERVPATLFSGIVTEDGVLAADDVEAVAEEHADLARWET